MKNKKIVQYAELAPHFKRRVMLKYHVDRANSIKTVEHEGATITGMEIWYQQADYFVLIDDRSLGLIEWDSCQETECEEELESFMRFGYPDEFLDDVGSLLNS